MAMLTQAPRGTQDVLPKDTAKFQYVERLALEIAELFGFKEMRIPTFEHTELFNRSVGDTTDVVQKEMYTFDDKGGRSLTLRPEGTSGVVRSVVERGLLNETLPLKVSYVLSCFRYEKPQAGRLREFHQFGLEAFGAPTAAGDAELMAMMCELFETIGLKDITLEINSIGCPTCRGEYHKKLRAYFDKYTEELCDTCKGRLEKNPLRILDCKSPICSKIAEGAPRILDYLCEDCAEHFTGLKASLDSMGIQYIVNPNIVRGLDYYVKTVFEFVSTSIGAQGTVCGGGRYDGLVELQGGPKVSATGFAMGIERLIMLMEKTGCEFPPRRDCMMYLGSIGEAATYRAQALGRKLRQEGFYVEYDTAGRSVKAQMKYADRLGCKFSAILGEDELTNGTAKVKNMKTGDIHEVKLDELVEFICDNEAAAFTDAIENSDIKQGE